MQVLLIMFNKARACIKPVYYKLFCAANNEFLGRGPVLKDGSVVFLGLLN